MVAEQRLQEQRSPISMATGSCVGFVVASAAKSCLSRTFALPGGISSSPTLATDGTEVAQMSMCHASNISGLSKATIGIGGLALSGAALASVQSSGNRRRRTARYNAADLEASSPSEFDPSTQVGAMAPVGFFDPLGFATPGDQQNFNILRGAELKHGRVAMMASIGLVAQHFIKFPGFEKIPSGIGAINTQLGLVAFMALFAWSGVLETGAWRDDPSNLRKQPGDFGDPFGIKMYNKEMREKEISNGRFAMISVTGILAAEIATGKDAIQQFGI